MHFIIAFIFVKFSGQAGKFASVEDKSPVNSWILQGTKENKISNICPMQHIDHHNTGMDLILQFYEGSSCQSMPPSPPQPEELCGSWRLWQGDYQHRERGPTYHAVPTNRNHAMPLLTSSHLEGWDGSHRQVSCTITSTNLWQGDYRHSKFAFHDRLSNASVRCTVFQNWEPSTTSLLQTAR